MVNKKALSGEQDTVQIRSKLEVICLCKHIQTPKSDVVRRSC